ncbi:Hypothetical_protein [Hexamita inflata]|uniref:Hypothetical_protein n=1 Tax=Hexamita inflata TaxID=28002 RepID=A0AA86RR29_9EUKA|nr:Hypothetical protein HINF_LOCUS58705 [Hexamita inflata]
MELHTNVIHKLMTQRKSMTRCITPNLVSNQESTHSPVEEEFSCQSSISITESVLSQVFSELFSRSPEPLLFQFQPLDAVPISIQTLKTETLCSIVKSQSKFLCSIPNEFVTELRLCKNKYNNVKKVIFDFEQLLRENVLFLLQSLNRIVNIPEYKMSSQNLSKIFAEIIFQGFETSDEKILKYLIEFAFEFE